MEELSVFDYVSLGIVLAASVFGLLRMFIRKSPLYFRLIVCAVWCFACQFGYYFLSILCKMDMPGFYNICFLGIGGSFLFFASANYGQFNSIIDEHGKRLRPVRLVSLTAPLAFLVWFVGICLNAESISPYTVAVLATSAVPIMIGSYFNLKFLIIRSDPLGLLKGVKPLNALELALDVICYFYIQYSLTGDEKVTSILYILLTLGISMTVLLAEWGRKSWRKQF